MSFSEKRKSRIIIQGLFFFQTICCGINRRLQHSHGNHGLGFYSQFLNISSNSNDNLDDNCRVSRLSNTSTNGYLSYPIEFLRNFNEEKLYDKVNLRDVYGAYRYVNCVFRENHPPRYQPSHDCTDGAVTEQYCPVNKDIVRAAMQLMEYRVNPSICRFISHARRNVHSRAIPDSSIQSNNDTLRVIVFGGSVTVGSDTGACCCLFQFDKERCPAELQTCLHQTAIEKEYEIRGACTWAGRLQFFLDEWAVGRKIIVNNYAIGGTTSMSLVHYLRDEDNWPELKTLKETDLIFIDYSVNDGLAHKTPLEVDQLERNLELIIRDLYSRMNSSIPAIVFIEHWPYGATAYYQPKPENPPAEGPSSDYAAGYRRVARHYHLPIWSYREAVWTDFAERNTSGFIEYLRFNNNLNSARQTRAHPPWPIHLYLSDIAASALLAHERVCQLETHHNPAHLRHHQLHSPTSRLRQDSPDDLRCRAGGRVYVTVAADTVYNLALNASLSMKAGIDSQPAATASLVRSFPLNGSRWKIAMEARNKPGWVCEASATGASTTRSLLYATPATPPIAPIGSDSATGAVLPGRPIDVNNVSHTLASNSVNAVNTRLLADAVKISTTNEDKEITGAAAGVKAAVEFVLAAAYNHTGGAALGAGTESRESLTAMAAEAGATAGAVAGATVILTGLRGSPIAAAGIAAEAAAGSGVALLESTAISNQPYDKYDALEFPFVIPSSLDSQSSTALLHISYLRTYLNAGAADVYVCNSRVMQLDALWEEPGRMRYSLTEVATAVVHLNATSCTGVEQQIEPSGGSSASAEPNGGSSASIRIVYRSARDRPEHRTHQKMKIISVRLCEI